MIFFKYEIYQVPWNSMQLGSMEKFQGIPWNFESGQNPMEFHGTWGFVAHVPWNFMEPQVLFK